MKCRFYHILYRLLPFNVIRSLLISKHLSTCPACSTDWADVSELKPLLVAPEDIEPDPDLWPRLRHDIRSPQAKMPESPISPFPWAATLRWGLAGAIVLLLVGIPGYLYFHQPEIQSGIVSVGEPGENKIVVKFLEIEGRPADCYYFQSKDKNKLILWAERPGGKPKPE